MEFFEIDETFIGAARPTTSSALGKGTALQADPLLLTIDANRGYGSMVDDGKRGVTLTYIGDKSSNTSKLRGSSIAFWTKTAMHFCKVQPSTNGLQKKIDKN